MMPVAVTKEREIEARFESVERVYVGWELVL